MKVIGKILGGLWVIAFGTFFVLNFVPKDKQPEILINYASQFEVGLDAFLTSPLFIVVFIIMWIFVSSESGKDSGWKQLANLYSSTYVEPKSVKFSTGSGYIGKISHNCMLRVYADELGFYVKAMFPFGVGHKPLLIPWDDIIKLSVEPALVPSRTPTILRKIAALLTRKRYMKFELRSLPDQNLVVHWEEKFDRFVPSSVLRG